MAEIFDDEQRVPVVDPVGNPTQIQVRPAEQMQRDPLTHWSPMRRQTASAWRLTSRVADNRVGSVTGRR